MAAQFATPEAVNFMAKEARGLICLALTPERCDKLGLNLMAAKNEAPLQTAFTVTIEAAGGVTTGISAHDRAPHDPGRDRPRLGPARPRRPRPHVPAAGQRGRRAGAHRPHRGLGRPGPPRRADPGRGDLRGDERRRLHGARPRPGPLLREARPEDGHDRRPDRLPAQDREAGRAGVATALPTEFGDFTAVGYRSLVDDQHHVAMVKGEVDGGRGRARPRAQRVPHRRRLPQHALRLRRAARGRAVR